MNSNVYIKSFEKGLKVNLSDSCDFNDLCNEISEKFRDSKNFFKGSKIAVSFEGRKLSFEEERKLIKIMEVCADMTVLYVIGNDEETDTGYLKVVDHNKDIPETGGNDSYFKTLNRTLKKGERFESEEGVVVIGDIEPGATLISSGNIVVLGGLYGSVQIKAEKDLNKFFVAAGEISCEKLKIGDYRYHSKEKAKWLIRPKMNPKIAYFKDDQINVELISKETLFGLCENMEI